MRKKGYIRIEWFLTDTCNLRCKHCYHESFANIDDTDYKYKRVLDEKIIDEIVNLSESWEIVSIGLLGGEPLMHPYIMEYINKIQLLIDTKVIIGTNGILLDDKIIKGIKDKSNIRIQISLDSPQKEEHDYYRGKGAYDKTVENIKLLVKNGIKPNLRMTVSNINIDRLEEFVKLGISLGAKSVSVNKYISDAKRNNEYMKSLDSNQHYRFLREIYELKKKYGEGFVCTEDPCQNIFRSLKIKDECKDEIEKGFIIGGCSAGLSNITISSKGEVFPCTILQIPLGNIKNQSLKEIWEGNNKVLEKLRNRSISLKGSCGKCENVLFCGGCRAAAYKMYGDYLEEDPFCIICDRRNVQ